MTRLAQKTFSFADQERFASVSGDRNPIHINAPQARRTPAGAPVVHGIQMLLWALDTLASSKPELPMLGGIRAQFNTFVYLGEPVDVSLTQQGPTGARLNISVDNGSRARVFLDFGDRPWVEPRWSAANLDRISLSLEPMQHEFERIPVRSARIPFVMTARDAAMLFPSVTKWIGAERVAALSASTCLVGMICPGLHSIYGELSVKTSAASDFPDSLAFRVTDIDPRFRLIEQEIAGGGLTGIVKSFFRPPPVQQASLDRLARVVSPTEFAGSEALIVGGSRGLGELTAKMIAAGGGRAIITWRIGRDDAERVAEEIRSAGGLCETLQYDAREPACEQLAGLLSAPTHGYYFATPTIFRPQTQIFSAERFKELLTVYVSGFWNLTQLLRTRQPKLSMFYPSSVFVTERPPGMTEYVMAKASGELLCADMNASLAPTQVTVVRLPRLPTDQTTSIGPVANVDAVETMLPIVRLVQSWPR